MNRAASPPSPAVRALPIGLVLRAALSRRKELSRRTRHRLALVATVVVVGREFIAQLSGAATVNSTSWALSAVACFAALSASAELGVGDSTDFGNLARLRGRTRSGRGLAAPLGRCLLAFGLHGAATLVLGTARIFSVGDGQSALAVLLTSVLLVVASLLGSAVLAAVAWLSGAIWPESPTFVYGAVLLLPVVLGTAIVELQGVFEIWARSNELLLRAVPS